MSADYLDRGDWERLRPRRRLIPWGRWRVLTRLWLESKAKTRADAIHARHRSMRMMRALSRGRSLKL